jgi:hypothetical protein
MLNNQIQKVTLILAALAAAAGCHKSHPESSTQPSMAAAKPATQPVDPNAGVVVQKPFIAWPHPSAKAAATAQPSVLLQEHARTDSPVPLSEYAKQKVFKLADFKLGPNLSAYDLQERLGWPAQLADYSDPWFVYRLSRGRELWLLFSQPDNARLLAADEIIPVEDGYTRKRVFSVDDSH